MSLTISFKTDDGQHFEVAVNNKDIVLNAIEDGLFAEIESYGDPSNPEREPAIRHEVEAKVKDLKSVLDIVDKLKI